MTDTMIADKLANDPHVRARHVRIGTRHGILVIDGRVDSYFAKQMAQESLRVLEGVGTIENRLKVEWT